jgi:predicted nucleic acid-binding protein
VIAFDASVLVYAYVEPDSGKHERARDVLDRGVRSGATILLLQTLAEFSHVAMQRYQAPPSGVAGIVTALRAATTTHGALEEDLAAALEVVRRHKLPFWDAMLWATADRVGVTHLFSEDLQDGRTLGHVRFVNPFAPKNEALIDQLLPR